MAEIARDAILWGGKHAAKAETEAAKVLDALKAAGVSPSSFAKDLAAHALFAGFTASELRSGRLGRH